MRLSEKKQAELYHAIADEVMDLRMYVNKMRLDCQPLSHDQLDEKLFSLQNSIWRRVHSVLNLEGPP